MPFFDAVRGNLAAHHHWAHDFKQPDSLTWTQSFCSPGEPSLAQTWPPKWTFPSRWIYPVLEDVGSWRHRAWRDWERVWVQGTKTFLLSWNKAIKHTGWKHSWEHLQQSLACVQYLEDKASTCSVREHALSFHSNTWQRAKARTDRKLFKITMGQEVCAITLGKQRLQVREIVFLNRLLQRTSPGSPLWACVVEDFVCAVNDAKISLPPPE